MITQKDLLIFHVKKKVILGLKESRISLIDNEDLFVKDVKGSGDETFLENK